MENSRQSGNINETLQAFEDTRASLKAFATLLGKSIFEGGGDLKRDSYGITLLLERQLDDLEDIEESLREATVELRKRVVEDDRIRVLLASVGMDASGPDVIANHLKGYFRNDGRITKISRYIGMDEETVKLVLSCALHPPSDEGMISAIEAQRRDRENAAFDKQSLLNHIGADDIHRIAQKHGLDDGTVYKIILDAALPQATEEEVAEMAQEDRQKPADLRKEFIADKLKEGVDAGQIAQALNLKRATVERVIGQLLAGQSKQDTDDGQQAVNG